MGYSPWAWAADVTTSASADPLHLQADPLVPSSPARRPRPVQEARQVPNGEGSQGRPARAVGVASIGRMLVARTQGADLGAYPAGAAATPTAACRTASPA